MAVEALEGEVNKAVKEAAESLKRFTQKQLQTQFKNRSPAWLSGIRTYHFPGQSYVRLGSAQSAFAQPTTEAKNVWILLPEGQKLGFKRFSDRYTWRNIQAKYGNKFFSQNTPKGTVILYRHSDGQIYPVYLKKERVTQSQRIDFFSEAEKIGSRLYNKVEGILNQV